MMWVVGFWGTFGVQAKSKWPRDNVNETTAPSGSTRELEHADFGIESHLSKQSMMMPSQHNC